ncbi:uncharacterized protein LOC125316163 [Rhodamnia argentea]|uniref:Uncharacterized protein LOC125316163 n=1 Tax=Rhodamnia argentea TaxID=178133 RepID=A0ABM3HSM0_9MYRT|nr:uncharacterized protein LOC125316163 [Rhodamnia argentea]
MPHGHNIRVHPRKMSNMISEPKDAGHILSDEQQVHTVIRSLPHNWVHMKVNPTHNESVKTFEDAMRCLELEEDRLLAAKVHYDVYVAGSSSHGASGFKRKHPSKFTKRADSGATDHVARDRSTFVEFRQIPSGVKWIYVGNNSRVEVKGIGYIDAVWGGDLDERKSTSGNVLLLNNGVISWSNKKQQCIALSTMEVEFVALLAAAQESTWLKRFLDHLGVTKDAVKLVKNEIKIEICM